MPKRNTKTIEERIKEKTIRSPGCWEWMGSHKNKQPVVYGFKVNKSTHYLYVNRAQWEQKHGKIPEGKIIARTCGNKNCVNPDHLICVEQDYFVNVPEGRELLKRNRKVPKPFNPLAVMAVRRG